MLWRILLVLFKSAVMVALFKLLSPMAEAIGLQLSFIDPIAREISYATSLPYRESEVLLLLVLATALLEVPRILWDLITG